eukprot:scaffold119632_cov51-Phaeocystis_antarctica.AAC.3
MPRRRSPPRPRRCELWLYLLRRSGYAYCGGHLGGGGGAVELCAELRDEVAHRRSEAVDARAEARRCVLEARGRGGREGG